MIPSATAFLGQDFEIEEQPTRTYKMNIADNSIKGYTDERDAMTQAIYKILSTERFQCLIYSANYGIELSDLFGQPASYVCPELERRISEALMWDDRITGVDNFEFDLKRKGEVCVKFTVHTVYGDISAERVVNY